MYHIHTYSPHTQTQRRGIHIPYIYIHIYHTHRHREGGDISHICILYIFIQCTHHTHREEKREHISTHTTEK